MAEFERSEEYERNEEVAEKICRDFAWNGRKFAMGRYVALLDGDVVADAETPEKAIAALRSIDPLPTRGMVFPVHPPVIDAIR